MLIYSKYIECKTGRVDNDLFYQKEKKMSSLPTPIIHQNCPDCGTALDYYLQELHPKSTRTPSWIGTCKNVNCTLHDVTLSDSEWGNLASDTELANKYRAMVAQMAGAK